MLLEFDWPFPATIIGTIATVVFGAWAIVLAKKRAYPGRISCFHDRTIRLFADITANLPQLAVSYKGEPVAKNVSLVTGYVMNTGSKDVTHEMIENPLRMNLNEGYRWLEASAKSPTEKEEHAKIIDARTVEVSFGLFRCDEFLRFEGLIEVGEGKRATLEMSVTHRIADTAAVKWVPIPRKPDKAWKTILGNLAITVVVLAGILAEINKTPPSKWAVTGGLLFLAAQLWLEVGSLTSDKEARRIRRILKIDSVKTATEPKTP
jgi:hypothetical protein